MDGNNSNEQLMALVLELKRDIERERDERKKLESALLKKVDEVLQSHQTTAEHLKKQVESAILKSASNSVRQVEAYMGIQGFFQTGEPALNFHGWPISSDVAQYLIGMASVERYDLIVEFGSGTSTVLFAKSMKILLEGRASSGESIQKLGESWVVTFEHHKEYLEKTKSALVSHGVLNHVDLVYAPLEEWVGGSEKYEFYSCFEKLSEMAGFFDGRKLKVMVLVDGPPGATCDNARYPALPILLEYFGGQEMHLILDDYYREEEREVVEKWSQLLDDRSIEYSLQRLPFEKGAALLKIN